MNQLLSVPKALDAVRKFSELRILVLGDLMLDIYDFCSEKDSKPLGSEAPGKKAYRVLESISIPGAAGNVATNLSSLKVRTSLISVEGNDGHRYTLRDLIASHNIEYHPVLDPSRPTTLKMRLYIDDQYLLRRDSESAKKIDHKTANKVWLTFKKHYRKANAVIFSDYNKGFFTAALSKKMIQACQSAGIPVIVDFKPANISYFQGSTIMGPNRIEAEMICPGFSDKQNLEASMKELHAKMGSKYAVVTLGGDGLAGSDGTSVFHVPGNKVQVKDAVGCGDTVRSVLGLSIALGLSFQEACELANDAATVIVQKRATSTITQDEIISFISNKN